ncbi:response regulator transcription factor [Glaciihabitans arcticus]|uniref:Response regulator transcription factor n=1 Tax=Glaciihabitans arcticus TaxID=2668039 RepID=A0A4Q9GRP5_9MICO|nr:response regulator transcription factor [Glaciihabitans arcticus]TBN56258.1 response regulator transcription factor [Glaciihabitans arcticus]
MADTATRSRTRAAALRVAIVDDHQLVLDGLTARLAPRSLGIEVVASVSRWSDLLVHPGFPVDVVVLDLNLDDGIAVDTKIRMLRSAGVSAVVMSRHADSASVHSAMRAGALGFVPKTESSEELILAIRSAGAGERHLSLTLERELEDFAATPDAGLGKQEQRALVLYATGRSIHEVALEMDTTDETIKSYIKRARRKYVAVDIDLSNRVLLRQHALRVGWIAPE